MNARKRKQKYYYTFRILLLLAAVLLHAGMPMSACADEEKPPRSIRIGYMDYGAFIEREADGDYTGFGVEYLTEISRYTDWTYEYVYDTWPNLLERLKNKEIDLLGTPQKTPEREKVYDFADIESGYEQTIIYTRADNDEIYYNDFQAMDGRRVGLLLSSYQTEFFINYARDHHFSYTSVYFESDDEMKEALKSGEVDLVAGGSLAMNTDLKVVGKEGKDAFYWMTYKGNDEVLSALNEAMYEIHNDNPYFSSELMQKYYGRSVVKSQPQFTRKQIEYIKTHPDIRVGCFRNAYPISSYDEETGEAKGICIDIMNMLANAAGFRVTYVPMDVSDSPELGLLGGEYDVFLPGAQTGYHANSVLVDSRPYFTNSMIPIIRDGTVFSTEREDYTVALVNGYTIAPDLLKKILPKYKTAWYENIDDCLKAVKNQEADLFFNDVYVAAYRLRSPFFEDLEEDFGHSVEKGYVLSALRSNNELIDVFNTCIMAIDPDRLGDFVANHTYASNYQESWAEWAYSNLLIIIFTILIFVVTTTFLSILFATQRKAVHQMAIKNKELEIANRARTTFLSNMSHEIRTPLNGIKGSLDILMKKGGYDEQTRHLLAMSAISADHLSNLVNDILDMSKLESGKLDLRNAFFDTASFVENICEIIEPLATKKDIHFSIETGENECEEIFADRSRLAQICINLLSNSIKYTNRGGLVRFAFATHPIDARYCRVIITIEDTGIGMSKEFLAKAFEPFVQERTSDTRNGTGLGLSITNALVTVMDGDLSITSELGKGTKAVVTLSTVWKSTHTNHKEAGPVSEDAALRSAPVKGLHLLLAEDNDINREIACIQAERYGFAVDTAADGTEAVDLFVKSSIGYYDLILMDIMMPKMDGLEATKLIRALKRPDAASITIVAMTANAYAEDIDRSMKSGMNMHLSKPFREEDLLAIFRAAAKKRQQAGGEEEEEDADKDKEKDNGKEKAKDNGKDKG